MDAMGKEFVHRIQSDVILVEGRSPGYLEQYLICVEIAAFGAVSTHFWLALAQ